VPARDEADAALSGGPLASLTGHGPYWGRSIVAADGGHPIRKPKGLSVIFGLFIEYPAEGSEAEPEEKAVLAWNSNCNGHSYMLEVTATRLNLSEEANTRKLCAGRVREEENWLERFFSANPRWRLANGRLTLTARGSRIVMEHRTPGV
jgi:hypothetical protein